MATDRKEYYREYNRKRMEDPERYAKFKKQVSESIHRKLTNDIDFAEMYRAKRMERYYAQKAILLKEQCPEDGCLKA
jgi:hypothetical protein